MQLVAVYGGPAIPLEAVSDVYFGLSYAEARRAAALNRLPVPTFRLTPSQKAPLMVRTAELAKYIDETADAAAAQWEKSQV
jgi:hypothetical protein